MIVVDTSALIAILLREPEAERCTAVIARNAELAMSAGTYAEALIVAQRRGMAREMTALLDGLDIEVWPLAAADARRVGDAYRLWGKGRHSAGLNFGDCFSYAAAKALDCPLLYVGEDFARTDLEAA